VITGARANRLDLFASEATLRVPLDDSKWCQLSLQLGASTVPLGADVPDKVLDRLQSRLAAPVQPPLGVIGGHQVFGVFTLSELHFTLYVAFVGSDRILYWEDRDGVLRHTQTLGSEDWRRWGDQIKEARQ